MNIIEAIVPFIRSTKQFVVRNASHILMGLGTGCGISGLIFMAKEAPLAKEAVEKKKIESENYELTIKDWILTTAKFYGPVAAMEVLSLLCFWSAHGIDIRRQAVLAGLATTAQEALREYQKKVIETIGADAEKDIRVAQAKDRIEQNPDLKQIWMLDPGTDYWYLYRNQRFKSSYNKIKEAQNLANAHMINHMYISELELMWLLDPERQYLKPEWDSGQIGWSLDSLIDLDINWVPDGDHKPIGSIEVKDKDGLRYQPSAGFSQLM